MHYWNRDNFEGLAQLAQSLSNDARLVDLAQYCKLREQGMRAEAFAALERFLVSTSRLSVEAQREVTLRVLDAHARTRAAHQFLTHPLEKRLIEPVLTAWLESAPHAAAPHLELGLLKRDVALLSRALALDPESDRARAGLASHLLGRVDHATHHLGEGRLLGTLEDACADLDEAERHLRGAVDPAVVASLAQEAASYRRLLDDFRAYRDHPTGDFVAFCRARGRDYDFPSIVYYDEDAAQQSDTDDVGQQVPVGRPST